MVAEVFAGISGFKTMPDIAKSFKDMNDTAARQGIAIELREQILTAQETQAALIDKVRALEKELASFETWEAEKQKYQLEAIALTAVAYVLKKESGSSEVPHWLCPNCFQNRKKSFFQYVSQGPVGRDRSNDVWGCGTCQAKILVPYTIKPGRI